MPIVRANEILKERYDVLKLSTLFGLIAGNLPSKKQWTMLIHGIAGGGKSTYALLFGKELSKFGNVLYGNFEEDVGATLQSKLRLTKLDTNKKIHFITPNTEEEFWKLLDTKQHKYAIVDSLSYVANQEKQVVSFWEKCKSHPNVSFIFICHALKSKDGKTRTNYRGMATIGHLVDINQVVEMGGIVRNDKNRLLGKETAKAKGFHIFKKILVS